MRGLRDIPQKYRLAIFTSLNPSPYLVPQNMTDLRDMHAFVVRWMREHDDKKMPYHGLAHTLDVVESAMRIANAEGIGNEEMDLLNAAALFHDTGHQISGPKNHEEVSCGFAREHLPQFGFDNIQVERICQLIMATRIPQSPFDKTSRALCDADLDYLGRPDFVSKGKNLFDEMRYRGDLATQREWNELQDRFLGMHHYHTKYAKKNRDPAKKKHHEQVRQWLKDNP